MESPANSRVERYSLQSASEKQTKVVSVSFTSCVSGLIGCGDEANAVLEGSALFSPFESKKALLMSVLERLKILKL